MLDILVWMWHDPHLQGSRGTRNRGVIAVPQLRYDLQIHGRRARKMLAAGKTPPPPPPPKPRVPPGTPSPPRFFKPEHVNRLAELFHVHLPVPHRFVCIADDVEGFSERVTAIKTPADAALAGAIRS